MERIRLDQHASEIHAAEQLFQCRPLTGFMRVVALLDEGDAKTPGVQSDMANKAVVAVVRFDG